MSCGVEAPVILREELLDVVAGAEDRAALKIDREGVDLAEQEGLASALPFERLSVEGERETLLVGAGSGEG